MTDQLTARGRTVFAADVIAPDTTTLLPSVNAAFEKTGPRTCTRSERVAGAALHNVGMTASGRTVVEPAVVGPTWTTAPALPVPACTCARSSIVSVRVAATAMSPV